MILRSLLLSFILCTGLLAQQDSLTLTFTFGTDANSKVFEMARQYTVAINARTKETPPFKLVFQTLRRSQQSLTLGSIDGDFSQPAQTFDSMELVIRVNEPVFNTPYIRYALPEYLEKVQNKIDTTAIYLILKNRNKEMAAWLDSIGLKHYEISNYQQAGKMITMNRAQVFLGARTNHRDSIFGELGLIADSTPILGIPLYLHLHKKHSSYKKELEEVIKILKEEQISKKLLNQK